MNNASTIVQSISSFGLRALVQQHASSAGSLRSVTSRTVCASWRSFSCCSSSNTEWGLSQRFVRKRASCGTRNGDNKWQELGKFSFSTATVRQNQHALSRSVTSTPSIRSTIRGTVKRNDVPKAHLAGLKDLSGKQIYDILGPALKRGQGNELLRELQVQRTTGCLDRKVNLPGATATLIAKALSWLRANYPVDEDAAIIRRIESEEQAEQDHLKAPYAPQQNVDQKDLYGESGLESLRKHYESEPAKSPADKVREGSKDTSLVQKPSERAVLDHPPEFVEWVQKYKDRARLSTYPEPPVMSKTARLLPSTIFCAVLLSLCIIFAPNYVPPPRKARFFPDLPPAAATVIAIVAINLAVTVMWRIPPMWRTLNLYFLMIPATPKAFTILGNIFSHQNPAHCFGNMFVLWFVGTRLHDDIGRGNFMAVYLSSGVFASLVSLARFVFTNNLKLSSLGASGALTGVLACWCTFHSDKHFRLAFMPSEFSPIVSSNVILFALLAFELFGIKRGFGRIDHVAHLGGYFAGSAGGYAIKTRARHRMEAEKERRKNLSFVDSIKEAV